MNSEIFLKASRISRRFAFSAVSAASSKTIAHSGAWCSGLTCGPVKAETAGSNPVAPANKKSAHFEQIFCFKHRVNHYIGSFAFDFDHYS